jgi:predicted  nucleic acid-binding Zn-ribbon protein
LTSWQTTDDRERLFRLRQTLKEAQKELVAAEADLADQKADVQRMAQRFEAQLGPLLDQATKLESEIASYRLLIDQRRAQDVLGAGYVPVEEQYRRTWEVPRTAQRAPESVNPADEREIKRLYRRLALQLHPDLASDPEERAYRTEKMAALNDAYAARSLTEMMALASQARQPLASPDNLQATAAQMIKALEAELSRIRSRLQQIQFEMNDLQNNPAMQLSLDIKLARLDGRNLLGEMAVELKHKIARLTVERDLLRSQFDELGAT